MNYKTRRVTYEEIEKYLKKSLEIQGSKIDSYLEGHILKSDFYIVSIDGEDACSFAVRNHEMLSHFFVEEKFRRYGQRLFEIAKRSDHVTYAYISTGDEMFLAHAVDSPKNIETQAYFFKASEAMPDMPLSREGFTIRQAVEADAEMILKDSGDFFDDINVQIENKELFVGMHKGAVVSYGIIERSKLYENTGSTGMYVVESHREGGYGTSTIKMLADLLVEEGSEPIAGCWYYNHYSKKTLERAGYYSMTRLMKVSF